MAGFGNRVIRAVKLDAELYEEVEADESSLGQAMCVVVLSSVAAGIGSVSAGLWGASRGNSGPCRMVYLGISDLFYRRKTVTGAPNKC